MQSLGNIPILILAGGYGTRISEETSRIPKPMVEIGGVPIVIHILRSYYAHGFNNFVICVGYRGIEIKKYFMSYSFQNNDLELDMREGKEHPKILGSSLGSEKWRIRVIDTGVDTMTGGRVGRCLAKLNQPFEHFGLTYGDGLTNADLGKELKFHLSHDKTGTVLGVKKLARYGELEVNSDDLVTSFLEKPEERQGYISGGFFFFRSKFQSYLSTDPALVLEKGPLTTLAGNHELKVFKHSGFWHPMDTLRDRVHLESLWKSGQAPWLTEAPIPLVPRKASSK